MKKTEKCYEMYLSILREEMLLAMGCTEPIAVAYAAAVARSLLENDAALTECEMHISGNIIKNVKSVIVPNTGGLKGLETAAAAGISVGDEKAGLQVLSHVSEKQKPAIQKLLQQCCFRVIPAEPGGRNFLHRNPFKNPHGNIPHRHPGISHQSNRGGAQRQGAQSPQSPLRPRAGRKLPDRPLPNECTGYSGFCPKRRFRGCAGAHRAANPL